jgi:hydrogenase nickel incorporation protein HypA/HybF
MHELSIATSLVDLACAEQARLGSPQVTALHLRLGPLAGVVSDALLFSFALAAEQTSISGARLVIESVPITIYCAHCDAEREIASPQHLCCPQCQNPTPNVIRGSELELFAMELADDAATDC